MLRAYPHGKTRLCVPLPDKLGGTRPACFTKTWSEQTEPSFYAMPAGINPTVRCYCSLTLKRAEKRGNLTEGPQRKRWMTRLVRRDYRQLRLKMPRRAVLALDLGCRGTSSLSGSTCPVGRTIGAAFTCGSRIGVLRTGLLAGVDCIDWMIGAPDPRVEPAMPAASSARRSRANASHGWLPAACRVFEDGRPCDPCTPEPLGNRSRRSGACE